VFSSPTAAATEGATIEEPYHIDGRFPTLVTAVFTTVRALFTTKNTEVTEKDRGGPVLPTG
jgi:hypothetical protein